ncbi:MAG: ubiquinol-cytochrome c reductase iron-sulfur subunit [Limnobacter sp.]|nr:ubiquinol-cytochrome c reductase iron-sulfur subunit [Limnobacter sp.]
MSSSSHSIRDPRLLAANAAAGASDSRPGPEGPDSDSRRGLLVATGALGGAAVAATAVPFVRSMSPSERALSAGAPVEVDISTLPPGGLQVVEWRGKPVWIQRRTEAMLASLQGHENELADPASEQPQQPEYARNPTRSIRPDIFVGIGICTHLGCSPVEVPAGSGNPSVPDDWPGGYFCPCHGSTFDLAGRVYRNKPAPTNLEVPPHRFLSETRILIGEDSEA